MDVYSPLEVTSRNMIRSATLEDITKILPLVEAFSKEIGDDYLADNYHPKYAAALLANCINTGICFVADDDGDITGVVAGTVTGNMWNPARKQADEQIYYVRGDRRGTSVGLRLIRKYIEAASGYDLSTLKLMKSSPELDKHYEKWGYHYLEKTFVRYGG